MKRTLMAIIMLLTLTCLFSGCGKSNDKYTVKLYFVNKDGTGIVSESAEISYKTKEDGVSATINKLLEGPSEAEHKAIIPKGTKLLGVKINNNIATVNFSAEFYDRENADSILLRSTIVSTLTSLKEIDRVRITINGEELINSKGEKIGIMQGDDIVYDTDINEEQKRTIVLYFSDANAEKLVPETRRISVSQKESVELQVLKELLKGPESQDLGKTIPSETKIISVETKERVCFVNLSQEFISKHPGGSAGETMTIYSIVNTLTELDNVEKVQFLIEGQKSESFIHMMLNEPFERDNDLISGK